MKPSVKSAAKPFLLLALATAIAGFPHLARAQDASFGCKVLLCAAATNPSWQGIAYCVPIMQTLMSLMGKRGFSSPPCPEAKTGAPGHEPHAPCPSGAAEVNVPADGQSAPMCARPTSMNAGFARTDSRIDPASLDSESLKQRFELTPRPLRDKPYFFEMPKADGAGTERVYFSLR